MMKKVLNSLKVIAILLVVFFSANQKSYATHAMGAEILYRCTGGNSYHFTYNFYFDCSSSIQMQSQYPTITMCYQSATLSQSGTFTVNYAAPVEVTPICPNQQSQCTNPNSSYPGVKWYKYEGDFTMPAQAPDWIFTSSMSARNGNINTITGNPSLTVFALLNNRDQNLPNTNTPGNNSPTFSSLPTPFICLGQTYCYNNGTIDPDGDSLVYTMITPLMGTCGSSTYMTDQVTFSSSTFDAFNPINSNPPAIFDSLNGSICVTPSALDIGVMAFMVKDFRNGVLVGIVERDIQINVINCINNIPTITGIDSTIIFVDTICSQTPFIFHVYSNDGDASDTVTMTANGLPPGATFTVTGPPHPVGTFTWMPPASAANTIDYCFTITVRDNACPYIGINTHAYCLRVVGANIGFGHSNVCDLTVHFTDTSTIPAGTITGWHWNFGDTLVTSDTSNLQNPTFTYPDTGFYNVRLVTTSSWGCNDTAFETIHIRVGPTIAATHTDVACFGGSTGTGHVSVTSGGVTPFTYLWSPIGGTAATASNLPAGTYNVVVTDSVLCASTATIVITQPTQLVLTPYQHNIYCHTAANSGLALITAAGGVGPYNYSWTPSVGTQGTASNLTAGNYTVLVTDSHGCTHTNIFTITQQNSLGTNQFQHNVNCFGAATGLAADTVFSQAPPFWYTWTSSTSTTSTASNLTVGTYTVTIDDHLGCTSTAIFNITSPPALVSLDTSVNILCNGGTNGFAGTLVTGGVTNYSYTWLPSGGTNTTASGLSAGLYTVLVTDANGCTKTSTFNLTQPAALVPSNSHSNVLCNGGSTGGALETPSGGVTGYNYVWSPSGGSAATASGLAQGTYTVLITDANGCTSTDMVTVTEPPQLNGFAQVSDTSICAGDADTLAVLGSSGTPGYQYLWSNGSNSQNVFVNPSITGINTYTVTITDANGCTITRTTYVDVHANPVPILTNDSACWGGATHIWVTNPQNGWQYLWTNPIGNTTDSITLNTDTTMADSLFVTDAFGCKSGWIIGGVFIKGAHVVADFTVDSLTGYEPLLVNFTNTSLPITGLSSLWIFGDPYTHPAWTDTSILYNTLHVYDSGGVYTATLIVVNQYGCVDSIKKIITVDKRSHMFPYNVFTPNGDGKNDLWWPDYKNVSDNHIEIFNRWGMKVRTITTMIGWDGTNDSGGLCPDGTYFYIVNSMGVDGTHYNFHGYITIIR
ncbi:MAG: gliding motility-associated C-terminal domain-containing protein [Bacteroidota bacterium]